MGTRAAAFNAKIQNLLDYHLRLLHGVVPPPSGHDIAVTLKYFSQTLLGVLKDIQAIPLEMFRNPELDATRLSLFPSLDYKELNEAIAKLVDVIPLVQFGTHAMGQAVLNTICCLVVFLDRESVNMLPYLVASMMISAPESLHQYIVDALCYYVLPFTIGTSAPEDTEENYADASIPAILMSVLQYSENTSHHSQLLECIMSLKTDIITELFSVIAYGTPKARPAAANLLFYYWPNFNPTLYERRGFHIRFTDISSVLKAMFNKSAQAAKSDSISQTDSGESKSPKGWKPLLCQLEECEGEGQNQASKVCFNHIISLGACPESPPPLYLCSNCASSLTSPESSTIQLVDIRMPMGQVAVSCENKNCRSNEKNAVVTCFSTECISYNGNKPIRYCAQCNTIRHNTRRGNDHIVHNVISCVWAMDPVTQNYVIEAIVGLLSEAQPLGDKAKAKDQERLSRACLFEEESVDALSVEDRRILSRYGVWLIVGLCTPTENTPVHIFGRLLGCLCFWFSATQYLPDDQQGAPIERLKTDYLHNWLQDVCKSHFDIFVSCLLPHPAEYAKVGGHWDTLATKSEHIKEGFRRLFCLVPYDLITLAVWEKVMPNWMEAIHNDVPERDLLDLKITLSKLLDPEMSPLGFDSTQMYSFIAKRFVDSDESVQEQTLSWLQLLSSLNISIPIYQLLEMFQDGVKALLGKKSHAKADSSGDKSKTATLEPVMEDESDGEGGDWGDGAAKKSFEETECEQTAPERTLTCFILMFDVFLKQLEVQEIERHKGVNGPVGIPFLTLMKDMLHSPCLAPHVCNGDQYCTTCDLTITYFQLTVDILAYLLPLLAIQNNRVADMIPPEPEPSKATRTSEDSRDVSKSGDVMSGGQISQQAAINRDMAFLAAVVNMPQIVTATVETVGELDFVANMPQEQVLSATATAVTITEEDVAHATASVDKASVVGVNDEPIDCTKPIDAEDESSFWVTSQGKFKFKLEQLPPHLQVIYNLLLLLEKAEDGDIVYHLCECLRYLILHGESFAQAASDHRGFLIWCQEYKDIYLMWSLLEAEWSHVAEICVALLLHFLTLPCGADIFWKLCENHFHHTDWKVRFQAVEKVVSVGRFLTVASVKLCPGLQAAIAHAFCFLLASLDDIHVAVAQRAHLYLTSLPDSGLRALSWCLEQQFDNVILDRPMIIQALHQLSSLLPDRKFLSWEFFYNRFDALYIEAQIALEKHGDITFPRDLRNSDLTSDIFARKLSRAQDALSLVQNASAKTLSSSLGTKWPYKRTMSAPANMFTRTEKQSFERSTYRVEATDGGMKVFDDGTMVHQMQRAMDLEDTDYDTLHLLVFLLMHFLSQAQHTGGVEDKGSTKVMNLVLRHLSILMGYSPQERNFVISPARLRCSPVFNSFISNLPQVLDHNFHMGKVLLPTAMPVLQFCPAPHKVNDMRFPTYSLWQLQPHPRRWWLTSVLTIMYKFDYTQQLLSSQIVSLIRIILMTLENHFHRCKRVIDPSLCTTNLSYSREVSQGSVGADGAEGGTEGTPPLSPNTGSAGGRSGVAATSGSQEQGRGMYGTDHKSAFTPVPGQDQRNDTEKGLSAIPESPKVETQETVGELISYEEIVIAEQATIRIERDDKEEQGLTQASIVSPPVETSVVVPQTLKPHGVTSIMASQIQAFDESFTVKIHDAELVQSTPFEYSSETISLDGNNQSWSTDLDQFAQLSGSELSLESACAQPVTTSVSISHEQEQSKMAVVTSGQLTPVSQGSSPSYAFRPILDQSGKSYCAQATEERQLSLGSDQESNTESVRIETITIQEPEIVAHPVSVNQIVDPRTIQLKPSRAIEPRIVRVQSTDSNHQGRHFSPQSPLSMMDLMTLGSPVEVDGHHSAAFETSPTGPTSPKVLELPTPERLLQVGLEQEIQDIATKEEEEDTSGSVLEQVRKTEIWMNNGKNSLKNGFSSVELHEVVTVKDMSKPELSQQAEKQDKLTLVKLEKIRQCQLSTDEPSENSMTITGSSQSGDRDTSSRSETKSSNNRSRCWEDLGSNYYSWSEPSEGLSAKGGKVSQPPIPPPSSSIKQSSLRVGEDCMVYRCMECGEVLEEFSNEDLGMCIIILSTFVHREPGLAAPLLPRMLKTVARVAGSEVFSWQYESPIHLPGSCTSIGRQFLRCVLHQLAPNQIFIQIFQSDIPDDHKMKLFKTLAQALTDFNELNPSAPIQSLLETLNSRKILPTENLGHILGNVAAYMECSSLEGNVGLSSYLIPLFDTFLRKVQLNVACLDNFDSLVTLLINILRLQGISAHKSILDPISKLLSYSIQNAPLQFEQLCDICYLCNRIFPRERDKLLLSRMVVFDLVQALKFKVMMPDTNIVLIIQMLLQDSGGTLGNNNVLEGLPQEILEGHAQHNTSLAECMRSHLHDSLEFIADVHTITRVKSSCRSTSGLNEDTIGGLIKAGIAQYLAIEITRGNSRDSRTIAKYLPWLQSAPTAVQQGPKEFIECVVHIRLLSWLLLGSLTHTCLVGPTSSIQCQPVPPEASCHIADHIQVILAGFPEHSKNTVQHMSSLYQTFILAQLWTLYLEQGAGSPASESHTSISAILNDFWAKITPAILQLVSHSKVLGEMVALHLMSLMEALQECQSSVLTKLLPLWAPVLYTQHAKMPGQLLVRLRACQDASPPKQDKTPCPSGTLGQPTSCALPSLSRWLHRLQFKMGQIEMQSSAAIQFYSV